MTIPRFLQPERMPFASVEISPAPPSLTHYVSYEHARRRRKSLAICGELVAERDHANEPTCPDCQRELAKTADHVFGTEALGTPVLLPQFDPLAGYLPRN